MAEGHQGRNGECDVTIQIPGTGQKGAYWSSKYLLSCHI
jgi:hypothetical protein